ncbi:MAG: uroporphyrinogen decarboxylase family protein [bacterium]
MEYSLEPLPKEEVIAAIERRGPVRIPMLMNIWWGEGLEEQHGARLDSLFRYPTDVVMEGFRFPPVEYPWYDPEARGKIGHDSGGVLWDWRYLDDYIATLPDYNAPGLSDATKLYVDDARAKNLYYIFSKWGLFFEPCWGLRGMQNLMIDYYENPDLIHKLNDALCDNTCGLIRRAAKDFQPNGFWSSDDLGHQQQLMMRPETFREFLLPYYKRVGKTCKEFGMHFWLHSCGDNTEIIEDLIEAGVNVFHPVQKHAMKEQEIAAKYGDRMTFLVGFDVQDKIVNGTPEEVRAEVRYLMDTFDRPDGGMCIAAGNGIVGGTPFENIEVFLDESVRYGYEHRAKMNGVKR